MKHLTQHIGRMRLPAAVGNPFNGSLYPLIPDSVTVADTLSLERLVISPDGLHAYTATSQSPGRVYQFSISLTGTLSALTPAYVTVDDAPYQLCISPDGKSVYVEGGAYSRIQHFNRDAGTGLLSFVAYQATWTQGQHNDMVVSPNGKFFYALLNGGAVERYSRNEVTGTIVFLDVTFGFSVPQSLLISPDGLNMYVAQGGPPGSIVQLSINQSTGVLTNIAELPTERLGRSTISIDGLSIYICGRLSGLYQFSRNPVTGLLTEIISSYVLPSTQGYIAISGDGTSVYATDANDFRLYQFARAADGSLSPYIPAYQTTAIVPYGLCVSPNNKYVYAVSLVGKINQFTRE